MNSVVKASGVAGPAQALGAVMRREPFTLSKEDLFPKLSLEGGDYGVDSGLTERGRSKEECVTEDTPIVSETHSNNPARTDSGTFNVVLLVTSVAKEHLQTIHLYKPFFRDVISWYDANQNDTALDTSPAMVRESGNETFVRCGGRQHNWSSQLSISHCVPSLLNQRYPGVRGMMVISAGFWMHPTRFVDEGRLDRFWMIGGGHKSESKDNAAGPHCVALERYEGGDILVNAGQWESGQAQSLQEAIKAVACRVPAMLGEL